jgi:hypothetical protein
MHSDNDKEEYYYSCCLRTLATLATLAFPLMSLPSYLTVRSVDYHSSFLKIINPDSSNVNGEILVILYSLLIGNLFRLTSISALWNDYLLRSPSKSISLPINDFN